MKKWLIPLLLGIYAVLMIKMIFFKDPAEVKAINTQLQSNAELMQYPYKFRVIKIDNGVATVTSPRSAQVSVLHALKIIHPEHAYKSPDSPEIIQDQKELANLQEIAAKIIKSSPDVSRIEWQIDKAWLGSNGIDISYM